MNPRISESIAQSIAAKQSILTDGDFIARIEKAADMIITSLKGGGKIHFCGNGVACESRAVEEHKTSAAGSADLAAAGTGLTCSVVDGVDAGIADPVALDVPAVVCCVGFAIRHILLLGFLIRFIFVMIVN